MHKILLLLSLTAGVALSPALQAQSKKDKEEREIREKPEDPFTGSATGAAAAYLWSRGLLADPFYLAEQGHDMGRPGQARVEVLGPPDAITGVRVGGQAHVLMSGELRL